MKKVLIVDDDPISRKLLSTILAEEALERIECGSGEEAIETLKKVSVDLIFMDQEMPGMNGFQTMVEIQKMNISVPIIFLTANAELEMAVEAIKMGAFDYLTKPLNHALIGFSTRRALKVDVLAHENEKLRSELSVKSKEIKFIGKCPQIQEINRQIQLVSKTNYSVLIQGESGTGKEVVANFIHYYSPRKDKIFLPIDTGTIPNDLVEGELFGHEKGAFTGADGDKKGCIESANGGTLFLDEIGNFSLDSQAKLLRVLQEGCVRRVGGTQTVPVDVRYLFATNENMEESVRDKKFRNDLYYRIAEFVITLPPLRERGDDILLLADALLDDCKKYLEKDLKFSDEAKAALVKHFWPGNVRELKNRIKRAGLICEAIIEPIHMFQPVAPSIKPFVEIFNLHLSYKETIEMVEKGLFQTALQRAQGNKMEAAKSIDMYYTSFVRRLKKLGVE